MRLWSLHPSLLDRAALLAGWRETLLAQKVLAGGTKGYTNHPQLRRFRTQPEPLDAIGAYLLELRAEATARGYRFDLTRILRPEPLPAPPRIPVTEGQLGYELEHLRAKCARRSPDWLERLPAPRTIPDAHPQLIAIPGDVEDWEIR
ncbi:pyrimidine dimer DNA glycosylase/endonuclease V [Brachybacterium squillarum]|uniref:pyrimidine dimer DNA glycosylase/endonuclease V n=1 Tax=Brachybacterium squillarum TaxID=661979 RepID=UPI000262998B|nr:pyrimidine dimer DNA glycosylase/endonuclease V [Brachybacterium squillarum]